MAQNYQEVVYLKNGSIIRGVVIEQIPDTSLKVKTADGSIFAYSMSEVEKIAKEETTEATNYNGSKSQISWNVKAGMNMSNWSGDTGEDTKVKIGYKVGVGMECALDKTWSIQPSLFFTTKGVKASGEVDSYPVDITVNQMYLELPVNVQARLPLTDGMNILLAAGPYFAYGIAGKSTADYNSNGQTITVKSDTFGDDGLKRFDAGLGLGVSLEIKKVIIGLDGQWGLTKLADSEGDTPKNINFGLTVGYRF